MCLPSAYFLSFSFQQLRQPTLSVSRHAVAGHAGRALQPLPLQRDASAPVAAQRGARVGLAHGAGKVAGEPDAIRALLVVIASSDGFAQAQRTPSRKSLRDFSPPSPMAALQL